MRLCKCTPNYRSLHRILHLEKSAEMRIVSSVANSQNCASFLPSFRPFALHSPIPTDRTGQEGIPPFPPFLLPPPASRAPSFPRVFSSILRRSSVRSQMKYNPLADGRTDGHGRTATRTVSGARLSEIGSFVPLLEGRTTTKGVL